MTASLEKDPARIARGKLAQRRGDEAEVYVAKALEKWWQAYEPEAKFVRTPLSGGWSGPLVRRGFRASGDVMTTSGSFPFCVEVKYRQFSRARLFGSGPSPVWAWWAQAVAAARESDRRPLLVFREPVGAGRGKTAPWLCIGVVRAFGRYVFPPTGGGVTVAIADFDALLRLPPQAVRQIRPGDAEHVPTP